VLKENRESLKLLVKIDLEKAGIVMIVMIEQGRRGREYDRQPSIENLGMYKSRFRLIKP
jgi:hypothetical protein